MFYFCELYHEIIKQKIFLKSNETQQGGGHKTGIKLCIYHPINLHGREIRFVNLFNQDKELWLRQT